MTAATTAVGGTQRVLILPIARTTDVRMRSAVSGGLDLGEGTLEISAEPGDAAPAATGAVGLCVVIG